MNFLENKEKQFCMEFFNYINMHQYILSTSGEGGLKGSVQKISVFAY